MARHENYRSENGGIENSQKSGKQAGEGSAVKRCVPATERGPTERALLYQSLSLSILLASLFSYFIGHLSYSPQNSSASNKFQFFLQQIKN